MRFYSLAMLIFTLFVTVNGSPVAAQQTPLEKFFAKETAAIAKSSQAELASVTKENWAEKQSQWRTELRMMLGLEPQPERTELKTTVTGTIHHTGVIIQRLHYQSRPGLYVPANLYLPEGDAPKEGWPAVLYVCGHSRVESNGRLLGNKTGYHHHGLWFARHGVACLIIDTVQLGELHGEHHGTYKLGRWDWISRGYTPAGVEAWNAIRGWMCSSHGRALMESAWGLPVAVEAARTVGMRLRSTTAFVRPFPLRHHRLAKPCNRWLRRRSLRLHVHDQLLRLGLCSSRRSHRSASFATCELG